MSDMIQRDAAIQAVFDWEQGKISGTLPDVLAALSAAPVGVRVKQLEWEPSVIRKPWHSAKAPWGWYYAQWDEETQAWFASLEMGEIEAPIILDPSDVPTIEEAKAAAQRDYEARILSALEAAHHVNETPKSEHDGADVLSAPALVEAGKVLEALALRGMQDNEMANHYVRRMEIDRIAAADTIRALIALATAQAAQIEGLEAKVRESAMQELASLGQAQEAYEAQVAAEAALATMTKERDALLAERDRFEAALARACLVGGTTSLVLRATAAEAEAATLRAENERLRGAINYLLTDVDDDLASAQIARAELEGKNE